MSQREDKAPVALSENRPARVSGVNWTFLTNHSHVLICLARDPDALLRDVARQVGITERAVQKILRELEADGIVERLREGRRNRYRVHLDQPLRHPVEAHCSVRQLLAMVLAPHGLPPEAPP